MLQPLNLVCRDCVQAFCTERRDEMQIQDRAFGRDAARLLSVGYRIVVDESLTERFECRDLLSGLAGETIDNCTSKTSRCIDVTRSCSCRFTGVTRAQKNVIEHEFGYTLS
jgi:hypothetical protein